MNLTVITGYKEYLQPQRVDRAQLLNVLRTVAPGAVLPALRWERGGEPLHYHTFLYDDAADQDRRVDLFLEYAGDAAGPDQTVFALLPFESAVDPGARGPTLGHPRVRHFVGRARERLGAGAVSCRRLLLSDNAQALLHRLEVLCRDPADTPTRTREIDGASDLLVTSLAVDRGGERPAIFADMQRNWGRAVLALGEQVVAAHSVFAAAGRAELVAELLEHNHLLLRADLAPDRLLDQLRPGGELFELLTKPLPPMPTPQTASATMEAAAGQKVGSS